MLPAIVWNGCARPELAAADVWPSYHPKLSRCAAWATLHSHTKYTTYNAKIRKKGKEKKKEWERAVIHRVDVEFECTQSECTTTGAPHNAVAIYSKCAKEGPAIFQHRTHIYLCLITFCELKVQRRHKGTCLHVARDCMITWCKGTQRRRAPHKRQTHHRCAAHGT